MDEQLVSVELRIRTSEDPAQLGDRLREAAAMIAGREAVEEFRVRAIPLHEPPKDPRPVD
ncbi:MAG: hypothetical protein H0W82_07815 [Actinobacteria bacterium]|nr:hypothetical protein [Actinomycetota bacterium]